MSVPSSVLLDEPQQYHALSDDAFVAAISAGVLAQELTPARLLELLHDGRQRLSLEAWGAFEDRLLPRLAKRAPGLRSLSLKGCLDASNVTLAKVLPRLPHLEFLSLNGCTRVKDSALQALARHCTKLTGLDLTYTSVGDVGACAVVLRCPGLRTLSLMGTLVSDTTLAVIGKNLERLEVLNVAHCDRLTPAALRSSKMWRLATLNLSSCAVDDSTVRALAATRARLSLRRLILADAGQLGPTAVDVLVSQFAALESVDLSNVPAIDAEAARKLYASHIRSINLFGTPFKSLERQQQQQQQQLQVQGGESNKENQR